LQVTKLTIDFNVFEGGGSPVETLTMDYEPGEPYFVFTMTCPAPAPPVVHRHSRWREYYQASHNVEGSEGGYTASDWSPVGGALYARKTYNLTTELVTETTTLNLKHTPQ
jgi:hypothetical protein